MPTILGILALAGLLFFYPALSEDTSDVCGAVETRSVRLLAELSGEDPTTFAILGPLFGLGGGEYAKQIAKSEYSVLPPLAGCTVMYWYSVVDRVGYVQKIAIKLNHMLN